VIKSEIVLRAEGGVKVALRKGVTSGRVILDIDVPGLSVPPIAVHDPEMLRGRDWLNDMYRKPVTENPPVYP
jgi:hypothetical protein